MALNEVDAAIESFMKAKELEPNDGQTLIMFSFIKQMMVSYIVSKRFNLSSMKSICSWNKKGAQGSTEEGMHTLAKAYYGLLISLLV